MSKVSSHIIKVAAPIKDELYGHSSATHALALNGFLDTQSQFIPRRFNVRTGKAYDIVERESDGVLFAVRGTNQDRTINISRFTGTRQDVE
jgi:hypothetical protein